MEGELARPETPTHKIEEALSLIDNGYTSGEAANIVGYEKTTVIRWYHRHRKASVPRRPKKRCPEIQKRNQEWARLYAHGLTTGQIALKYNVTQSCVTRAIRTTCPTGYLSDLRKGSDHERRL